MKNLQEIMCQELSGVGAKAVMWLGRLGIYSLWELLLHLPFRYEDRTRIKALNQLVVGEFALVQGVVRVVTKPMRGKTKLLIQLNDETGKIAVRFFHLHPFQLKQFKLGVALRCYGSIRLSELGLEMSHPEFQVLQPMAHPPLAQHLTAVYRSTEGLSQSAWRKMMAQALSCLHREQEMMEGVPKIFLKERAYPNLYTALQFIHQPPEASVMPALLAVTTVYQQRLIFEELLAHRLSLMQLKNVVKTQSGFAFAAQGELVQTFLNQLPFILTVAQVKVIEEIKQDLSCSTPMLRLVQGDVGSGKTVIAVVALLQAVENGYQAAMMAPTTLLAEQHYRVMQAWLAPLGVEVVFFSGGMRARDKNYNLSIIAKGIAQIVIGTHALFQEAIVFAKLGLVVTDEQHRFGVGQRELLRQKGKQGEGYPHQLMLTATPIPRTLMMSFYATLDCSIINQRPKGRIPITTSVISNARRSEVINRIQATCAEQRQVYWVCPLIDESEQITCAAATQTAHTLQEELVGWQVGLLHGRMTATQKEKVMRAFQAGEIQILVATTVIEVGVDVPRASLMIVENAERLGLAQLHQLRGRVGRGAIASYCILFYSQPLPEIARMRLATMRETDDGFVIAERDLELRGPGEMLGTKQSGHWQFHVADLLRDSTLLSDVCRVADSIMRDYPEWVGNLVQRWVKCDDPDYPS